jgi:AraC family transcriptional regulator of adaptative response/methylated-DNA-[protein]-cysteine methyltransferase
MCAVYGLARDLAVNCAITAQAKETQRSQSGNFRRRRYIATVENMATMREHRPNIVNNEMQFACGSTTIGSTLVACSSVGICAIFLGDDANSLVDDLRDQFPKANLLDAGRALDSIVAKVVEFFENPCRELGLPLDVQGTTFQRQVWDALRRIPPGNTVSYADIAQSLDAPKAVRAVAGACAANVLAGAIPCHRVVKSDGTISGYRWGIDRKRELLRRETPSALTAFERGVVYS